MFAWGQKRPQFPSRDEQLASLKAALPAISDAGNNVYKIGLLLQDPKYNGKVLHVSIILPSGFPETAGPQMAVSDGESSGTCSHPLLNAQQLVVNSPEINSWTPSKNLGAVVQSVMDRFYIQPPVYNPPRNIQPVAPVQPQLNPAYGNQQSNMAGSSGAGTAGQGPSTQGQAQGMPQYPPAQYPPAGAGTQPQSPAPAPAPAPAPPRRPALSVPAVPSRFNGLDELTLEELQALLEDEDAQLAFLHRHVPDLGTATATLAAQRTAAIETARDTLALEERIRCMAAEVMPALEAEAASEREGLATVMKRAQSISERYKPERIARELEAYAEEQDKTSVALAESFANSDPLEYADRFGSAAGGGGGAGGSFYAGTQYSGGPGGSNPGLSVAGWGSPASTAMNLGVSQGTPSALLDASVAGAGAAAAAAVTSPAGLYSAGASTMVGDPSNVLGRSGGTGGLGSSASVAAAQQQQQAQQQASAASVQALKEFREEYLALRRRYHTARIQADILRKVGVAT